jgi:2,3-diaminopropionate biosynthesis protein SbnA
MIGNCNEKRKLWKVPSLLPLPEKRSILDFIGRTPLVPLRKLNRNPKTSILMKLEGFNPGGSLKDRSVLCMVEEAEKKGILNKDSVLIDSTSGNLGIALAMTGAVKGYKVICIVDPKISASNLQLLKSFGVQIERVETADSPSGYLRARIRHRNELLKELPNAWCPDQYANLANPLAHYMGTGQEILEDTQGRVDYLVCAISTGGTISGCARALKEKIPSVKVIGVDAVGSAIFGDTPQKRLQTGIGSSLTLEELPNIDASLIDQVFLIEDETAFLTARALVREEGLLVGGSSGTVTFAALLISNELTRSARIVGVLPDRYEHNLNECHREEWMQEHGFALEATTEAVWKRLDLFAKKKQQWIHSSTGIPIIKKA